MRAKAKSVRSIHPLLRGQVKDAAYDLETVIDGSRATRCRCLSSIQAASFHYGACRAAPDLSWA